jgi:DNA-binding beta-propeller fold protein YncE
MTGGLAIDREDRVYVSSTNPNQIVQYTRQGALLRQWPVDPADPGQIGLVLAADRHGVAALVFAADGSAAVQAFDPQGDRRFRWPSTGTLPLVSGLAVALTGELWVAQLAPHATTLVYRVDGATGVLVDTLVVAMPMLNGMALGPQTGVAVIPFGETVGFGIFDLATGAVLRIVGGSPGSGTGQFSAPVAGVFGTDGRLFIVDGFNNRIQVFREGEYLTMWGTRGTAPGAFHFSGVSPFGLVGFTQVLAGIAVETDGTIYVADTFNNRIQVFAP